MRLAEMESIALNVCLAVFVAFVFFIIYDLAKKSNAGKFGTLMLFVVLGMGLFAFVIKTVVVELMGNGQI